MSFSPLSDKRDEVIRFRAEADLKSRIAVIAKKRRKKPAEYLREEMWKLVEQEDARPAGAKTPKARRSA